VTFYLKTFLIAGVSLSAFAHMVTRESMPWWPDTVIMGVTFGTAATLIAIKARMDRRARHDLWTALKSAIHR
jgi:hypothetical protein